jgi:hypothetical protein
VAKICAEAICPEKHLRSKNFGCELEVKSGCVAEEENSYPGDKIGGKNRKQRRWLIPAV